jgi:hypothetical protein
VSKLTRGTGVFGTKKYRDEPPWTLRKNKITRFPIAGDPNFGFDPQRSNFFPKRKKLRKLNIYFEKRYIIIYNFTKIILNLKNLDKWDCLWNYFCT